MENPNIFEDDDWALVELFRWQYGKLPYNDYRKLDVSEGLRKMAEALEKACKPHTRSDNDDIPALHNVISVLYFCSKRLKGHDVLATTGKNSKDQ